MSIIKVFWGNLEGVCNLHVDGCHDRQSYHIYFKHSGLLPYMEWGHERSISFKTLNICLGKNLSMEMKDIEDFNIIPKSHKFSMFRCLLATKWNFPTLNNRIQRFCKYILNFVEPLFKKLNWLVRICLKIIIGIF